MHCENDGLGFLGIRRTLFGFVTKLVAIAVLASRGDLLSAAEFHVGPATTAAHVDLVPVCSAPIGSLPPSSDMGDGRPTLSASYTRPMSGGGKSWSSGFAQAGWIDRGSAARVPVGIPMVAKPSFFGHPVKIPQNRLVLEAPYGRHQTELNATVVDSAIMQSSVNFDAERAVRVLGTKELVGAGANQVFELDASISQGTHPLNLLPHPSSLTTSSSELSVRSTWPVPVVGYAGAIDLAR